MEAHGKRLMMEIVRNQGEWFNGHGFPLGIEGVAIPFSARAYAVSRMAMAMFEGRADRRIECLAALSGSMLDPEMVQKCTEFLVGLGRDWKQDEDGLATGG